MYVHTYICLCVFVCVCVYMHIECRYPQMPEEGVRYPGVRATGGCESSDMGCHRHHTLSYKVLLCSSGWPQTHYIDQVSLEFPAISQPLPPKSQGVKVHATRLGYIFYLVKKERNCLKLINE